MNLFPQIYKFSQDDKPWFTSKLKGIDRRKKREYKKNHKSPKYLALKSEYKDCMKKDKARYYKDIVIDLKKSDPKKWYSKLKRMTGKHISNTDSPNIQELQNVEPSGQPDVLATHFAQTRNLFEPVKSEDFEDFLRGRLLDPQTLFIQPQKICDVLRTINQNAATVKDDIPVKLFTQFSSHLSLPLTHIINCMLEQ